MAAGGSRDRAGENRRRVLLGDKVCFLADESVGFKGITLSLVRFTFRLSRKTVEDARRRKYRRHV